MERRALNKDEFVQKTEEAVKQLDAFRDEQMKLTRDLLVRKNKAQEAEKLRLLKKYGDKHPEYARITARLAYNKQLIPAVYTHIDLVNTPSEPLPASSWRVMGIVADKQGKPQENVTVLLVDDKQHPVKTFPSACSQKNGYYEVTLSKEQIPEKPITFFLAISQPKKKIIVQEKNSLTPVSGSRVYVDIILDDDQCGSPYSKKSK